MLAPRIPLSCSAQEKEVLRDYSQITTVLVDDCKGTRARWVLTGRHAQQEVLAVASFQELQPHLLHLPLDIPIHVDFKLAPHDLQGAAITKKLIDLHFSQVHLTTGMPAEEIQSQVPWLTPDRIHDKEPTWS